MAPLIALVCWLSLSTAVSAAASAAVPRHAARRLQTEDVSTAAAEQRSQATASGSRPHPSRRPSVGHSHPPQRHRAPPDPRAPELTAIHTHHSRWFQQHRRPAAATPSPAHSGAPRPHAAPDSSGHSRVSSNSVRRKPTGRKPSSSRTFGRGSKHPATQPPPQDGTKLRKVRIQPCSVDHGTATEVQVRPSPVSPTLQSPESRECCTVLLFQMLSTPSASERMARLEARCLMTICASSTQVLLNKLAQMGTTPGYGGVLSAHVAARKTRKPVAYERLCLWAESTDESLDRQQSRRPARRRQGRRAPA